MQRLYELVFEVSFDLCDLEWVARVPNIEEYKFLSGIGPTPESALQELARVLSDVDEFY